ncbi:MAG: hypothetical protein IKJ43_02865 [Bacilli bacterium]|nr:hypothetical protein [Bacilli bacterium]
MFCQKCGNQLNGTEAVCPNCGTPVSNQMNSQNIQSQQPMGQPNPQMGTQPVNQPMPQYQQPVNQPMPQYQQPNQFNNQPKNNTTIILIVALAVVAIVAVLLFVFVFNGDKKTTPTGGTTGETKVPEQTDNGDNGDNGTPVSTGNKVSYAGYSFTVPTGYESEVVNEGLAIYTESICYIIQVDYTNTYEEYKQAMAQKYPDQVSNMIANINGKEYIAAQVIDASGNNGGLLITKASSTASFVAGVVKRDYSKIALNDVQDLSIILSSATQGNSSFGPGNNVDAGKDGIITDNTKISSAVKFK